MSCYYCGSEEITQFLDAKVGDATHQCRRCFSKWIRLGPHKPIHATYSDVKLTIDGKEVGVLSDLRYSLDKEVERLEPDVDPKAKLENAYLLTLSPATEPSVFWDSSFYDWWIRNLKPKKNVVIMNLKDL